MFVSKSPHACRPQKGRYRQQAKFVLWGTKGHRPGNVGPILPGVFRYPNVMGAVRFHQTQKPVALMADLLAIVEPGGTVLDPFMGSGSTGEAAFQHGLGSVGIEANQTYFDAARQRLSDLLQVTAP